MISPGYVGGRDDSMAQDMALVVCGDGLISIFDKYQMIATNEIESGEP